MRNDSSVYTASGKVTYDKNRNSIIVNPTSSLYNSTYYELRITGVTNTQGESIGDIKKLVNTDRIFDFRDISLNSAGEPIQNYVKSYVNDWTQTIHFDNPGPDSEWSTNKGLQKKLWVDFDSEGSSNKTTSISHSSNRYFYD